MTLNEDVNPQEIVSDVKMTGNQKKIILTTTETQDCFIVH